jgi:hypothetical protein
MSKIADKLIEIDELLARGATVYEAAELAGVPVEWVINRDQIIDEFVNYNLIKEYNDN